METDFRTKVDVKPFPFGINYITPTMFLGSCFSENIGNMLATRKFPVLVNPFGVVYNPQSVGLVLNRIITGELYQESNLINHNNFWLSVDHHTSFSNPNRELCINGINSSLANAHQFWEQTQCLAITFGTARVYNLKKSGKPVANCHKIPAKEFTHTLLSVDEIVGYWHTLIAKMLTLNPNLKIIFTVSPVRHWKDGAVGNQVSKSTLILAVNQLVNHFPQNVFYFPAYEIMMDDLRDYRFYADDMLHPSSLAISYIWDQFKKAVVSHDAQLLSAEIEKIILAVNHKPFNVNTKEYKQFVSTTLMKIDDLTQRNKELSFHSEITTLKDRLLNESF
jgi:hypothetical protein